MGIPVFSEKSKGEGEILYGLLEMFWCFLAPSLTRLGSFVARVSLLWDLARKLWSRDSRTVWNSCLDDLELRVA